MSDESTVEDGRRTSPLLAEAATALAAHLGRELLAIVTDCRPSTVEAWLAGSAVPTDTEAEHLLGAYAVWRDLVRVDSPTTVRAWFMGAKEQLGDLSPAEAVANGDIAAVRSIARDFIEGG